MNDVARILFFLAKKRRIFLIITFLIIAYFQFFVHRFAMKKIFSILLVLLAVNQVQAQHRKTFVDFINSPHRWVDSVFNSLTPEEQVAQLFMVRAHSNRGEAYIDSVAGVIEREQLGGIVLFQGGPIGHAQVINRYQRISKVPLLIALDGEWGLGMRMPDSTVSYPYQMTLGAIQNEGLIYQMGREVAKDFKRLGMNINLAPVVDVNNNPNNPVIGFRSFGEDKYNVTRKGSAYMRGMMDEGIIVSLKHFPGHGDTDVDSHYDLPVLNFSRGRLDSLEIYPFRELIKAGAGGVMVAHMHIPSLDNTANLPSSISKPVVTDILKDELGFRGLTITDAMDMQGVVKFFKNGEADIRAIIAGNDLLELSENSERAIKMVLEAIKTGRLEQQEIEHRVKKILASKYWLGLDQAKNRKVEVRNIHKELNRWSSGVLNQRLADAAVTLLNGNQAINKLDFTKRTAIISVGEANHITEFQKQLGRKFDNSLYFVIPHDANADEITAVTKELWRYDQVIIALHDSRSRPRTTLPYSPEVKMLISELAAGEAIFSVFANAYALAGLPGIEKAKSLLVCYQNDDIMQKAAAKVILRTLKPTGKLPVSINSTYKSGDGIQ